MGTSKESSNSALKTDKCQKELFGLSKQGLEFEWMQSCVQEKQLQNWHKERIPAVYSTTLV